MTFKRELKSIPFSLRATKNGFKKSFDLNVFFLILNLYNVNDLLENFLLIGWVSFVAKEGRRTKNSKNL